MLVLKMRVMGVRRGPHQDLFNLCVVCKQVQFRSFAADGRRLTASGSRTGIIKVRAQAVFGRTIAVATKVVIISGLPLNINPPPLRPRRGDSTECETSGGPPPVRPTRPLATCSLRQALIPSSLRHPPLPRVPLPSPSAPAWAVHLIFVRPHRMLPRC
jgi:hypothetical protein